MKYCQDTKGNYYKSPEHCYVRGTLITKAEYDSHMKPYLKEIKLLKKSIYPAQGNDYFLIKIPKTFPKKDNPNKYIRLIGN